MCGLKKQILSDELAFFTNYYKKNWEAIIKFYQR